MFMRIDRRFMAKCFGQMQELGIYPGQIPVLGLLAHKDGLSQREIAEKLHIKPPTVNVTVQRLEKAGFLYREADEKDQRISRIYMTEKGKQAKESGMKKVQDNEKILLDGFSEEDLCLLRRFRAQLVDIAFGFCDRPAVFRNQAHEAQLRRFVFDAQKRPCVAF